MEDNLPTIEIVAARDIVPGEVVSIWSPVHREPCSYQAEKRGNLYVPADMYTVYSTGEGFSDAGRLLVASKHITKGEYLRVTNDRYHQDDISLFCSPEPNQQRESCGSWIALHAQSPTPTLDADIMELVEWLE